ncbi:MAG: nuclease-related domain-containing protein, partial [Methylophaga sp.]
MDFAPIYQTLLSFWFLIPLFIIATVVKSAWFKGIFGEFIINVFARWKLDRDVYHLIKNVTLPTEDGTTQIDHIIISVFGVFVVETKNLRGWIYGSPKQKMWTQKIYRNTYRFQNPLHQNYKHTQTLQALLTLEDQQMHSVVVFIGDSTFKTAMPDNVTYGMGYIHHIQSKSEILLSPKQVLEITQLIEAGRLTRTLKTNREHVRHVQKITADKEHSQLCPKCGSEMLL